MFSKDIFILCKFFSHVWQQLNCLLWSFEPSDIIFFSLTSLFQNFDEKERVKFSSEKKHVIWALYTGLGYCVGAMKQDVSDDFIFNLLPVKTEIYPHFFLMLWNLLFMFEYFGKAEMSTHSIKSKNLWKRT